MLFKLSVFIAALSIAGCAHHKDVRPGTEGLHRVIVEEEEKEDASREAIRQARHYCESIQKHTAAVVDEKTTYIGSIDENARKTIKQVSSAASLIGGAVATQGFVSGDRQSQNIGGATSLGGAAGKTITEGKNYRTEMTFRCQ